MEYTVLILPGLFNSGEGHWQSLWEEPLPNARRVHQSSWDTPERADWVAALDKAIVEASGPVILAAHSLGCALAVWWAKTHGTAQHADKVKGALLAAPPDVEREDFPTFVRGFSPMPRVALPFNAIVVSSSNDPWCDAARAQSWADAWKARCLDLGPRGHINAESGLGDWQQGQAWLRELASS